MLGEELDAVSTGHRVGYEEPAYFSRDSDQRKRLLEIAQRCPVHRSLTSPIQIITTLAL
jgi:uncharacterized OsmC-like protein